MFLDEVEPTLEQLKAAIRRATISRKFTPVFMGSALADKFIQPMLDGVCDYLPNPGEVANMALDTRNKEAPVKLIPYNSLPFVGLAFKLEESNFGQLTYIRVYQGALRKGTNVFNARTIRRSRSLVSFVCILMRWRMSRKLALVKSAPCSVSTVHLEIPSPTDNLVIP